MDFVHLVADDAEDVVSALQHMHRNLSQTEEFIFIARDGKQQFSSHPLILAIHSCVLGDMIYGPSSCRTIKIEDVDNFAIENLIRYCYAEDLVFKSVSDVTETKIVADKFQILELSRICVEKLSSINVNLSNVISVLETSIEFINAEKESECLSLINEHKEEVFTSEPFKAIKFEKVLEIFEKLRGRNFFTEFEFLHSAIQWLETNERRNEGKEELMNKIDISRISLNEYLDIIVSFPEFFSNTEISGAVILIRSSEQNGDNEELNQQEGAENQPINLIKFYQDAETNTEGIDHTRSNEQTDDNEELRNEQEIVGNQLTVNEIKFLDAETNTEKTNQTAILIQDSQNLKQLTIQKLKESDGGNAFHWPERVKVVVKDDISTRSIQFPICNRLKNGLIGSMTEDVYNAKDVDISYEGIFYMTSILQNIDYRLSPLQYIESLKAAQYFKLTELSEKLILNIKNIIDYDPAFLKALNSFSYMKDRCLYLLTSKPMEVIVHPNYINCCVELIVLLLEQDELKIGSESQALYTCIVWLEAQNHKRWHFRSFLLNKIAFENISTIDFQYGINTYPEFFTDSEKESILNYKRAEGDENKAIFREKLPKWYNFKSRRISDPN